MAQFVSSAAFVIFFINFLNFGFAYNLNQTADSRNLNQTTDPPCPCVPVVNGRLTAINEFPFMAALGWTDNATNLTDYSAGGMLIANNIVLTAAHGVFLKGKPPNLISIGGNNLDSKFNEIHAVEEVLLHPEYNKTLAYNDIALIMFDKSSWLQKVCLWRQTTLSTSNATAIGYGATHFAGSRTNDLLKVKLTSYPEKVCQPHFKRKKNFPSGIISSQICAGDPEGKRDTCQGDSGGPLLVVHNNRAYAAGITSTGQACSGYPPAVYTRVSYFIKWIEETLRSCGQLLNKDCDLQL